VNEEEAYRKLAKGVLRVNIVSIILGVIVGTLSSLINGFFTFWICIHAIPYIYVRKKGLKATL